MLLIIVKPFRHKYKVSSLTVTTQSTLYIACLSITIYIYFLSLRTSAALVPFCKYGASQASAALQIQLPEESIKVT